MSHSKNNNENAKDPDHQVPMKLPHARTEQYPDRKQKSPNTKQEVK